MSLISNTTRSHPVVKRDIALRMDFARISNLLLISLKTVDQFTAKLSSFLSQLFILVTCVLTTWLLILSTKYKNLSITVYLSSQKVKLGLSHTHQNCTFSFTLLVLNQALVLYVTTCSLGFSSSESVSNYSIISMYCRFPKHLSRVVIIVQSFQKTHPAVQSNSKSLFATVCDIYV